MQRRPRGRKGSLYIITISDGTPTLSLYIAYARVHGLHRATIVSTPMHPFLLLFSLRGLALSFNNSRLLQGAFRIVGPDQALFD